MAQFVAGYEWVEGGAAAGGKLVESRQKLKNPQKFKKPEKSEKFGKAIGLEKRLSKHQSFFDFCQGCCA